MEGSAEAGSVEGLVEAGVEAEGSAEAGEAEAGSEVAGLGEAGSEAAGSGEAAAAVVRRCLCPLEIESLVAHHMSHQQYSSTSSIGRARVLWARSHAGSQRRRKRRHGRNCNKSICFWR